MSVGGEGPVGVGGEGPVSGQEPREYEPPPGVGKLALWILLFVVAAIVVVAGGVYFG